MDEKSIYYDSEKSSAGGGTESREKRAKPTKLEPLTAKIIDGIIKVHKTLGPGFTKSVYHAALALELKSGELNIEENRQVPIVYNGTQVGTQNLDIVVDGQVILELKTVDQLEPADYAQLRSYLRAAGLEVGLLVNFARERSDFRRVEI